MLGQNRAMVPNQLEHLYPFFFLCIEKKKTTTTTNQSCCRNRMEPGPSETQWAAALSHKMSKEGEKMYHNGTD